MATPTRQQADQHYATQATIAVGAARAVAATFRRWRGWPEVIRTVAAYQNAAATAGAQSVAGFSDDEPLTQPRAFAGVSSMGYSITEPIVATIDARVPAPAEPLPDNWWEDEIAKFLPAVERLIENEIRDAGRTASQVEFVSRPEWQNYVRMLQPPSCSRCAILAGRIYRDLDTFDRHDGCDCVMIPVQNWETAHDAGLVSSFADAFEKGQVRNLSRADAQAISDGANPIEVVNARRAGLRAPAGITNAITTEIFGRRVKATPHGTTRRAAWRRANPNRPVRLRPESIYQFATDRDDAIRLLRLYGYLT